MCLKLNEMQVEAREYIHDFNMILERLLQPSH